jgi:5-methylcytosine-specific restriction endonuclease McrBC regulatory subunit McrC
MYQLYAYGKKYTEEDKPPRLILFYPKNKDFKMPLDDFIYDGDLVLGVMSFDLKNLFIKKKKKRRLIKL